MGQKKQIKKWQMQFHGDYFIKAVYWDTRFIIRAHPNPFLTTVKIQ